MSGNPSREPVSPPMVNKLAQSGGTKPEGEEEREQSESARGSKEGVDGKERKVCR